MLVLLSSHCPVCGYAGGRAPVVTQAALDRAHLVSRTDPVSTAPSSLASTWSALGWIVSEIRCSPDAKQNVVPDGHSSTTWAALSVVLIVTPLQVGASAGPLRNVPSAGGVAGVVAACAGRGPGATRLMLTATIARTALFIAEPPVAQVSPERTPHGAASL